MDLHVFPIPIPPSHLPLHPIPLGLPNAPTGKITRKADMVNCHVSPSICNFLQTIISERCGINYVLLLREAVLAVHTYTQATLEELSIWAVGYDF